MAIEKASFDSSDEPSAVSRTALEKALDELQEAFDSCPKSTIKRRLKKKAKNIKWPAAYTADPSK